MVDYRKLSDFTLPEWLRAELKEPREPSELTFEDGKYKVSVPRESGEYDVNSYDSLAEAYTAHHEDSSNMVINKSVYEAEGEDSFFLSFPSENSKFMTMVIAMSDSERIGILESSFSNFLEDAKEYREDPKDFRKAYLFVVNHPAFWLREDPTKSKKRKRDYWWNTSCDQEIWMAPYFGKDEKTKEPYSGWMLELGGHIAPEYSTRYHDLRLDSYGETIEEAFINLAERVNMFFNDDGTEKENVEYEKSELELELEERIADIEEFKEKE